MKARKSVESLEQNLAETIAQSVDKMNLLFTWRRKIRFYNFDIQPSSVNLFIWRKSVRYQNGNSQALEHIYIKLIS